MNEIQVKPLRGTSRALGAQPILTRYRFTRRLGHSVIGSLSFALNRRSPENRKHADEYSALFIELRKKWNEALVPNMGGPVLQAAQPNGRRRRRSDAAQAQEG